MKAMIVAALALLADCPLSQFSVSSSSSLWARADTSGAPPESTFYGYSDCTVENALGLTDGGEIAWFQGASTLDQGVTADVVSLMTAMNGQPNGCVPRPATGAVYVYDDPGGDDTDPTDLGGGDLRGAQVWNTMSCLGNKDNVLLADRGIVTGGFWFAAMMEQFPGEFPAPFDTDTAPSNGHSWITGSNTAFDPLDPGGGVGFFEMAALGFDAHWVMSAQGSGIGIVSYCTAKAGLTCGTPAFQTSGLPTAGASSGFVITTGPALAGKAGLYLYSCDGRAALPFEGGVLCVAPPVRRTVIVDSGGTSGCTGSFQLDWNAFASGNAGGNPHPCVQSVGQFVTLQCWGRDTPATGAFLSSGLEFVML